MEFQHLETDAAEGRLDGKGWANAEQGSQEKNQRAAKPKPQLKTKGRIFPPMA